MCLMENKQKGSARQELKPVRVGPGVAGCRGGRLRV